MLRRSRLPSAVLAAAVALCGAARAAEPQASVEGVEDKSLRQAIQTYIGTTKRAPATRLEARRRAQSAADGATVVLRSEGYYEYSVVPDVSEGGQPHAVVRIEPGIRFVIADPEISWANQAPLPKAQTDAGAAIKLAQGSPGRAADVLAAEGRIVGALQHDGYADVVAAPREVVVDHADHSVRPTFRMDAGALVKLDGVQVHTDGRTNPAWVASLTPWTSGQVYSPDPVAELERRLRDTGVYTTVAVALAPQPNLDGLRPVVVTLVDRPKATVSFGASYSTSEGAGVNGRLSLYNRLRRADTITLSAQYANILKRADAEISLPDFGEALHTLRVGATAYDDNTDAYEEKDAGVHVDLEHRFAKTSFRTYGVSLDFSHDNEETLAGGVITGRIRDLTLVTGLYRLSLDRSNDPLDPTSGWKFDGRIEPTYGFGDNSLGYIKAQAQVSGYLPLDKLARTVLAARLELGSVLSSGDTIDLPAARRFFSGGGGSIRGYAYQAVGPRFPDGTPMGGQSLIESSFEVRQKFGPSLGLVAFVDAGTVSAEKYPDFSTFSVGAGVGLRYNLGFGPLRFDVAMPLNRREGDGPFQIYLSIGQAF